MSSDPTSTHQRVLALFEEHRAAPGASFEAANFLSYLLPDQKLPSNSSAGLRRFNRFIDAVQLEYSICFSLKDKEANYSLDSFVARVIELRASRRSSLASLRNQERHGFGWHVVVLLNFLAVLGCTLAYRHIPIMGGLLVTLLAVANALVLKFYFEQRSYMRSLRAKIESSNHNDA